MAEVIVFPDAAELVIAYLTDELPAYGYPDVHVGARIPTQRPDTFVRVDAVGGARRNVVVDAATLAVESWAPRADLAMTLAQTVRALVHAMAGTVVDGVTVYSVDEFAAPASFPDPTSNQPRATQTLQIQTRGTPPLSS